MTNVWLPSVVLWEGMQSRASALPMLMQDAFQYDSPVAMHRVRASLCELAALACFVQARQFSLYCRECIKLLELYEQNAPRRTTLATVLLCAALRASQSLATPLMYQIGSANLNELRQARGASSIEQEEHKHRAAWAVPRLKVLLHKQLFRTHYTLGDATKVSEDAGVAAQPNSFLSLNAVAALCFGEVLLEKVRHQQNYLQTCLRILRVDLCCNRSIESAPPKTFSEMKRIFIELSIQKILRELTKELRALTQTTDKQGGLNLKSSLLVFYKINICCEFLRSRHSQSINKISVCAQQLAIYLRCWEHKECEANALLCLCVLTLERELNIVIAVLQDLKPCERTDIRLRRKVQHYIRTRRRRSRTMYAVPIGSAREIAHKELIDIHLKFRNNSKHYKQTQSLTLVEDALFHALVRFKTIALYLGEMSLYELLWNLREVLVLVIERKLLVTNFPFSLLPRLSAYAMRHIKQGQVVLGYDSRLISRFCEQIRAQRQLEPYKFVLRDNRILLPERQGRRQTQQSITTVQLPRFLAKNIHCLVAYPVEIYECQSGAEFSGLSRGVVLELSLLARGARALQVDRVAALCEVLLEIYRSLNGLSVLPERRVLKRNLKCAHRCLRLALNQAAARQKVCDVRPTIVSLYHFLECLHQAPENTSDILQTALGAVNSLAADMRGFADILANTVDHGLGTRNQLANEQLQGLLAATRRLQEDLAANGMINIARWGRLCASLWGVIAMS